MTTPGKKHKGKKHKKGASKNASNANTEFHTGGSRTPSNVGS